MIPLFICPPSRQIANNYACLAIQFHSYTHSYITIVIYKHFAGSLTFAQILQILSAHASVI